MLRIKTTNRVIGFCRSLLLMLSSVCCGVCACLCVGRYLGLPSFSSIIVIFLFFCYFYYYIYIYYYCYYHHNNNNNSLLHCNHQNLDFIPTSGAYLEIRQRASLFDFIGLLLFMPSFVRFPINEKFASCLFLTQSHREPSSCYRIAIISIWTLSLLSRRI